MGLQGVTWRPDDVDPTIAAQWDQMASGRGTQADVLSSHAWFRAVLDGRLGADPHVEIPAVLRDDVPVGLLPLRRKGWLWTAAHDDHGPRVRPVLDSTAPEAETLGMLVDQMGQAGVRELVLRGLPTRDPATTGLVTALREAGFDTEVREKRTDNVVVVTDDSEAYERSLRKLATSCRSRERRVSPFWDMEVTTYGNDGKPLDEGVALFEAISAESWKGARRVAARRTRQTLLARADERGWVSLVILTIGGRPAAGNVYFRLGEVFCGWNTVYDQRMAVLSPGHILHNHVQQTVHLDPPGLMDLLPGNNAFKDTLKVQQPALLDVEARRPGVLRSGSHPARRWARHHLPHAQYRAQMRLVQLRNGLRRRRASAAPDQRLQITPGSGAGGEGTVAEIELTVALQRYVAVVHGLPSATAVTSRWPDDRWFHVDLEAGGSALARLAAAAAPDEGGAAPASGLDVVPLEAGTDLRKVAEAVATQVGGTVELVLPRGASEVASEDDVPALPWSPQLLAEGSSPRS
jgi:hypothetical protein